MQLSVVAPCFNEAEGLQEFYQRTSKAIHSAKVELYEIVLVDDGSSDGTWDEIRRLHSLDRRVRGVRLSRNFGHQSALMAGLIEARGMNVLIIDADLQDPPELLGQMLEAQKGGLDVVYGR